MSEYLDWRPRMSIDITVEQKRELDKFLDWGMKRKVFSIIIDDLIEAVKENGPEVIGALLTRSIKTGDITKELKGGDTIKP